MMLDDDLHAEFQTGLDNPWSWFSTAEYHRAAAGVLFEELMRLDKRAGLRQETRIIGCMQGALLLLSASAENAIKAVIVRKSKHRVAGGRIQKKFWQHKLTDLCALGGIALSDDEKKLVAKLSHHAAWAGRFRLPKFSRDWAAASAREYRRTGTRDFDYLDGLLLRLKPMAGWTDDYGWPDV